MASVISESNITNFIHNQERYGSDRISLIKKQTPKLIGETLNESWFSEDNFVLLVTGSDWRKENRRNSSSVEMIAYTKSHISKDHLHEIAVKLWWLMTWYNDHSLATKTYWSNNIEIENKYFSNVSWFEDPYAHYSTPFPTRFIDWVIVYWAPQNKQELTDIFHQEIKEMSHNIISNFRSRVRYARDISNTWKRLFKGEMIDHFDLEKWVIYYEKTPSLERWIKMWPLRLIQYKVAMLLSQLIKNKKIAPEELYEINSFTKNKLEFILPYIALSDWDKYDLNLIYYTCLKIHQICQKKLKNTTETMGRVTFELDSDESKQMQEMLHSLNKIIGSMSITS